MCKRTDPPNGAAGRSLRESCEAHNASPALEDDLRDHAVGEVLSTKRTASAITIAALASPEPTLRRAMRAPLTIMAVLAALLMGLWWLTGGRRGATSRRRGAGARAGGRDRPPGRGAARPATSTRCRGRSPVTPEQARREGLEDLDRSYPEARRRADEQVLKLLGLIDPSVDLRDVSALACSPRACAGYYDPRTKRMRTVRGAATGTRVLAEMVLAHELTHALEDQRYGLGLEDQGGSDDAALARLALVEGTRLRADVRLRRPPLHARGDARRRARERVRRHRARCPASCRRSSCSPTRAARRSSSALRERAGGRWTLVDLAERSRAAGLDRAGHAPGASGCASSRRCGCGPAPARRSGAGWERAARRGARGVPDARAALARGRRRVRGGRGRAGAGTATSCGGAAAGRTARRRAGRDAALIGALALGHAGRLAGVRGKLRQWVRDGLGRASTAGPRVGAWRVAWRGR